MTEPSASPPSNPRWLSPAPVALWLVAVVAAFFLPAEGPLQWYPLNSADQNILYLTARLASDRNGEATFGYRLSTDTVDAWRTIRLPISPTGELLTYVFPLADAPVAAVRLQGLAGSGTLRVSDLQITDRRARALAAVDPAALRVTPNATLVRSAEGWALRSNASAAPAAEYTFPTPLLAEGATRRNVERCLRSTGYLAAMAGLLLGAVALAIAPPSRRELPALLAYLVLVSVSVSAAAHRDLIRETVRVARYVPPATSPGLTLEVELVAPNTSPIQVFWDVGRGINQADSARAAVPERAVLHVLRFPLPAALLHLVRFDPGDDAGVVLVRALRLVDRAGRIRATLPPRALLAGQNSRIETGATDAVRVICTAPDPTTTLAPDAVALVNQANAATR